MFGLIIFFLFCSGQKNVEEVLPPFDTVPRSFPVNTTMKEASGIASSKINPGYIWVHEDSGTPAQISLLKNDGIFLKSIPVQGASNIDWEDMSLSKGPNPSLDYIYLADIGDNLLVRADYTIYRFPEPGLAVDTVQTIDKIRFRYPDGSHNAEAFVVDNVTRDIYLITKSDNPSQIYKLPYPQSVTSLNQAVPAGQLSFGGVTGAAISVDGKEIIIKTYPALNYFVRNPSGKIEEIIKKTPVNLAYQLEPQGEAVAFAADNSGFYTLSEKSFSAFVNLYFYKRK